MGVDANEACLQFLRQNPTAATGFEKEVIKAIDRADDLGFGGTREALKELLRDEAQSVYLALTSSSDFMSRTLRPNGLNEHGSGTPHCARSAQTTGFPTIH